MYHKSLYLVSISDNAYLHRYIIIENTRLLYVWDISLIYVHTYGYCPQLSWIMSYILILIQYFDLLHFNLFCPSLAQLNIISTTFFFLPWLDILCIIYLWAGSENLASKLTTRALPLDFTRYNWRINSWGYSSDCQTLFSVSR